MSLADSRRRIAGLVRKELSQLLRDPKTKRIMFGSPIIQLLLFGYAVTTDVHRVPLAVLDRDNTAESRGLQDALTAGGYFRIVDTPDATPGEALARGHAMIGLEIPPGFARDLDAGRGARVQMIVDGTNSNTATVAQGYALRIVQRYGLDHWTTPQHAAPCPQGAWIFARARGTTPS
jgi:ABC-2 type transport system permease protein